MNFKDSKYSITFSNGNSMLFRDKIREQKSKLQYAGKMLLLYKMMLSYKRELDIVDYQIPHEKVAYIGWKNLYKELSEERRQIKKLISRVNRNNDLIRKNNESK